MNATGEGGISDRERAERHRSLRLVPALVVGAVPLPAVPVLLASAVPGLTGSLCYMPADYPHREALGGPSTSGLRY